MASDDKIISKISEIKYYLKLIEIYTDGSSMRKPKVRGGL